MVARHKPEAIHTSGHFHDLMAEKRLWVRLDLVEILRK
jgi:hypothetical protein